VPIGHFSQVLSAVFSKKPASQAWQAPPAEEIWPLGHATHAAPEMEDSPALQAEQSPDDVDPAGELSPASQNEQLA
jgi:hypothetical protein